MPKVSLKNMALVTRKPLNAVALSTSDFNEVYMLPRPRYNHSPSKVCGLQNTLYPKTSKLLVPGFQSLALPYQLLGFNGGINHGYDMFLSKTNGGTTILLLYVDYVIITRDDSISI